MAEQLEPVVAGVLCAAFEGVGGEVVTAGRYAVVHHPHICCARHLDEAGLLCFFEDAVHFVDATVWPGEGQHQLRVHNGALVAHFFGQRQRPPFQTKRLGQVAGLEGRLRQPPVGFGQFHGRRQGFEHGDGLYGRLSCLGAAPRAPEDIRQLSQYPALALPVAQLTPASERLLERSNALVALVGQVALVAPAARAGRPAAPAGGCHRT